MHDMMVDLNRSLVQMLDERSLRVPSFDFDVAAHSTFRPEATSFDDYVGAHIMIHQRRRSCSGVDMDPIEVVKERKDKPSIIGKERPILQPRMPREEKNED